MVVNWTGSPSIYLVSNSIQLCVSPKGDYHLKALSLFHLFVHMHYILGTSLIANRLNVKAT